MDEILQKLNTVGRDQQKLETLNRLEQAVNEVKKSCSEEYSTTLSSVIEKIKEKMKANPNMVKAVENFSHNFVPIEKRGEAEEALYGMLSAEIAQTVQVLSHTSCVVC